MSTGNVARRLIELCRTRQFRALDELYADDARRNAVMGTDGERSNRDGIAAIRVSAKRLEDSYTQVHSLTVSDPLIAGPFFTIVMGLDATRKDGGRYSAREVCVYEVRNDKIVREQFFHSSSG